MSSRIIFLNIIFYRSFNDLFLSHKANSMILDHIGNGKADEVLLFSDRVGKIRKTVWTPSYLMSDIHR